MTAAQAAAQLLRTRLPRGAKVLVVGGAGLVTAVRAAGYEVVHSADDEPAAVAQGFAPEVGLAAAGGGGVRRRARCVARGVEPRPQPADRARVRARERVARRRRARGDRRRCPDSAGKPSPTMYDMAVERVGRPRDARHRRPSRHRPGRRARGRLHRPARADRVSARRATTCSRSRGSVRTSSAPTCARCSSRTPSRSRAPRAGGRCADASARVRRRRARARSRDAVVRRGRGRRRPGRVRGGVGGGRRRASRSTRRRSRSSATGARPRLTCGDRPVCGDGSVSGCAR